MAPQLTTGSVLIEAAARPQTDGNAAAFEHTLKRIDPGAGGPLELLLLDRVVRDQVHVALKATNAIRQFLGMLGPIVQIPQEDVLETDAASSQGQVMAAILQ